MPAHQVECDVAQLARDYASGLPLRLVAARHGIGLSTAWRLLRRERVTLRKPGDRGFTGNEKAEAA